MDLHRQIALVTGANRGLGAHLVDALLAADVTRVYAAARRPERIAAHVVADPRVVAVQLDVTDEASVRAAAAAAPDVTLLVNNAGSLTFGGVVDDDLDGARQDLETNYFGTLRVIRTFLPSLERAAPAAIVNVLTLIALAPVGPMAGYSASKAAAHSMTQALRAAVRERGIRVFAAYPGGIDTDMLAGIDAVKAPPADVAHRIVAALAADREVVFPDEASAAAGEVYASDPYKLERMLAG